MIIVLRPEVEMQQAEIILKKIEDKGLKPLCMPGIERIVLGAIGDERILQSLNLEADPAVEELRPILSKYKLVSKEFHSHEKIVKIGSTKFGGGHLGIIAGPCGIETLVQALDSAEYINETGVTCFRAGIFKPRTSPYSFQGLGLEGLSILNEIKKQYNMSIVSEVIETKDIELIYEHVDAYQIGARNMQNYRLLEAVGKTNKPVVLKRGMSATVEEFLLAAEYIYNAGNDQIILCERGIRTFETTTRNTLDLNSVAYIKEKSQLPIIVDPSHGTGVRNLVNPLTKAAIAVGADGIIVETHPNPEVALSDGKQSLYPQQFKQLIREISQISTIFWKNLMISEINLGKMTSINLQIDCIVDPVIFFNKFSMSKNTLLLMSSEIDSKKKQESLMILESAVKIVAHDRLISVIALTENGKDLLTHLLNIFSETEISKVSQDEIQIKFESQTDSKISEDERLRCEGPFSIVRKIIASIDCLESKSDLFLGGNFSYDFIETFEKLAPVSKSETSCPYFTLYVAQLMAKVDHSTGKSKLQTCLFGGKSYTRSFHEYSRKMGEIKKSYGQLSKKEFDNTTFPESNSFNYEMNISDEEFAKHVSNIKQKIIEGDIFQAVLSRTFKMSCNNALKCFRNLIGINPGPYMFYMNDDDFELFGSSPESALKFLAKERSIHIYPIAGTRRRGLKEDGTIDLDLDGRHELELRMCEKEVAEHMMLVDLARNDVAKISQTGTRFVSPLMKVDRYSRVMHLVSQVNGILKEDLDALHAYQATMNMGTLTGAPKISAINIVRNIEKQERGPYGGAVGYITGEGNFDTCIVIRSAFVKNKMAYVQAGAGVVYDSDPMAEAMETKDKAHAVIKAIQLSEDQYE